MGIIKHCIFIYVPVSRAIFFLPEKLKTFLSSLNIFFKNQMEMMIKMVTNTAATTG